MQDKDDEMIEQLEECEGLIEDPDSLIWMPY